MALWGAPVAHEDDAERAVRAGLDLVDAVQALGPGIQARCGVLTGEAAVTLGATEPGHGRGRPREHGIAAAVGRARRARCSSARRSSGRRALAIAYEEAGEQLLKGKVAPVPAWRAVRIVAERARPRSRRPPRGPVRRPRHGAAPAQGPVPGDVARAPGPARVVTGQGGIGKSRLAWEFQKYLDGLVEPIFWHEGRSPSYGEGITFWSLGEMVRSRAHLLETDDPVTTRTRIARDARAARPRRGRSGGGSSPRCSRCSGRATAPAGGPAELFSAWRTFFERVASKGVVVLLFEDLQWADPGTLDFIEHVLEWSRNVPILIVTLARPELLEQRPGWGAGKRAFLALDLQPLDDAVDARAPRRARRRPARGGRALDRRARRGHPAVRGGDHPDARRRRPAARARGRHRLRAGRRAGRARGAGHAACADRRATRRARHRGPRPGPGRGHRSASRSRSAPSRRSPASKPRRRANAARPPRPGRPAAARGRPAVTRAAASTRSSRRSSGRSRTRRCRCATGAAATSPPRATSSRSGTTSSPAPSPPTISPPTARPPRVPRPRRSSAQARIALRAAAERAIALGAPGQAVTFLDQAIEVTDASADRADLHERAGAAASNAATQEVALGHFEAARRLYEELGDRPSQARMVAREGDALGRLRRRDEAMARLDRGWVEFADLGDDDPNLIGIGRQIAQHRHDAGRLRRGRRRWPTSSSRSPNATGLADAGRERAARRWARRRSIRAGSGRLAPCSRGRARSPRRRRSPRRSLRALVMLPSITALDDPRGALATERDGDRPRPARSATGPARSTSSTTRSRTRAGPATGTGRSRSSAAIGQLDIDESSLVGNRAQQVFFEVYRGTFDATELPELHRRIEVARRPRRARPGSSTSTASIALAAGDWADAADAWMAVAELSDLNAPYSLPRAGRAAILAGDAATAQAAVDRLDRARHAGAGDRRRPRRDPRRASRRSPGDRAGARAGYRRGAHRVPRPRAAWDEALVGHGGRPVGSGDGDAELAGVDRDVARDPSPGSAPCRCSPASTRRSSTATRRVANGAVAACRAGRSHAAASADASVSIGEG